MEVTGGRALVTGANRGLGEQFVEALLARGAATVYAGARDPGALASLVERHGERVVPLRLDVTDPRDVAAAADRCERLDLLVSNAGQACVGQVLSAPDEAAFRSVFEVNLFGPLALVRALAPQLRASQGGILFVLSLAALVVSRSSPMYSASKAASMMLASGVRSELRTDNVLVTCSFPGFVDTDMSKDMLVPKASPRVVAERSLDGLQERRTAVFPDRMAELVREAVFTNMPAVLDDPHALMTQLVGQLGDEARP